MVIFDCERMKFPRTGLYAFCDRLGHALLCESGENAPDELGFYVPSSCVGHFGNGSPYLRKRFWHKFHLAPRVDVWHSAYQLTRYIPSDVPVVQTIHDLNYLYEDLSPARRDRYCRRIQRHLQRVDRIVAISEFVRQDILTHLDTGTIPVEVVYNGCDEYRGEVHPPAQLPLRPFLFTVGTVLRKKNFHALPCLLRVCDYDLVIAGNLSDYARQIEAEARRWGVAGRVHCVGGVSEAVKHWYLQHCEAFLFPSIAEGFGLPVVEAMAYGKPLFLSSHTSLPEIGGDCACYFPTDFNPDGMCSVFVRGLETFGQPGGIGPEKVRQRAALFSWRQAARRYWEIYKEVRQSK